MIQALEEELAEAAPAEAPGPARPRAAARDGAIVLSRVTFRHAAERPATLEDVSLAIPAGAFVGVVGPSGAGKTTFLDLVAGLLAPDAGRICADGRELEGEGLARHRERLAYVGQDAFLFDDTVRRNLAWSRPDSTEAEMLAALDLVGAGALLRRLELGLDTRIGERGVLISAGERQRLALARALLRRPALLALDEATNAIDVASERAVLERLARLGPDTTILMVAHRAESLALCDHILAFPGPKLSKVSAPGARRRVLGARRPS
jgi:ATP-binding cassette subfamily C protein